MGRIIIIGLRGGVLTLSGSILVEVDTRHLVNDVLTISGYCVSRSWVINLRRRQPGLDGCSRRPADDPTDRPTRRRWNAIENQRRHLLDNRVT